MDFQPTAITIKVEQVYGSPQEAPGFEAAGTGLGYFIDEAPKEDEWAFSVNGVDVYRKPDRTRYCVTHLSSGLGFPGWFYSEQSARLFIEHMVKLLNWTLPIEEITKLPAWAHLNATWKKIAEEDART